MPRAVSLEKEVFDAVMLVKRLGRDVREGKRRQFSYIGRLLRDVEPELIGGLIQATKDGDMQKFQEVLGSDKSDLAEGYGHSHDIATKWFNGLVNKDADITSEIYSLSTVDFDRQRLGRDVREGKRRQFSYIGRLLRDVEPELIGGLIQATKDGDMQKFQEVLGSDKSDLAEGYGHSHDIATKWFNGLVNKDADITSEIYSLSTVDFDRQELRKLVRNFCSLQDSNATPVESEGETKVDKKLLRAEKHLNRFLVSLAKQLPIEEDYIL
ncbi:hypothetical protein CTI12_AA463740 [Artemisia annua]|uniref:Uncharacterized protein n=1 Tax=Artemisia annua TaxID=35608 RepID=A0A2U1LQB9_ARTAN|nr:hypothetical protein CTI12_AA463740 [Artemisia annua]